MGLFHTERSGRAKFAARSCNEAWEHRPSAAFSEGCFSADSNGDTAGKYLWASRTCLNVLGSANSCCCWLRCQHAAVHHRKSRVGYEPHQFDLGRKLLGLSPCRVIFHFSLCWLGGSYFRFPQLRLLSRLKVHLIDNRWRSCLGVFCLLNRRLLPILVLWAVQPFSAWIRVGSLRHKGVSAFLPPFRYCSKEWGRLRLFRLPKAQGRAP